MNGIARFCDISRLASSISDNDSIFVRSDGSVGATGLQLDGHIVTLMPEGAHFLTKDDFFASLAKSAGQPFADQLRATLEVSGPTLETRQIKVLTEHSRVAVELHSHVRQLTEGLKAEPSAAQDDTKVADLLNTVYADQSVAAVLDKSSVAAAKAALETAQHDYQTARHHLSGLTGSQLANGDADATKWLADYVKAEMDLAEKISDLANVLRRELRTAEGVNEIQELLGQLDDLAMSVELNGVKLERLGAELAEVKDATVVNEIVPEFDSLVQGMNPNEDERRTANEAIESFVTTAKPLLDEIAKLDHAGPDAQTATFVASLKAALDSAKNALAGLARLPGVNKDGLRQFDANLDRARQTLVTCQTNMRQHLYESGKRELYQLLLTAQSAVHNAADHLNLKKKAVAFTNSLASYILDIDKDPTQTDQIFTRVQDFLRQENTKAAKANRPSLVKLSGLDNFRQKLTALRALVSDISLDSPFSRINARLLGQALRGEVDVLNYVSLKEAGLTDDMFWPELVEKPGATKKFIGSGMFNSVDKLDMTNVRTGTTTTVVLKDVEISRGISSFGVAKPFSDESQVLETGKINLATAKAARLIGCGQQVTNCGFVRVGDRYLLAQEMASGDVVRRAMPDPRNAKYTMFEMPDPNHPGKRKSVSFASGYAALPPAGREKLKKELMIATAKLEWADLLTGQLDRSGMNMMLKVDVYGDDPDNLHVLVELKGIDNDAGFTEGQTSVKTFKTTNGDVYDAQNPTDKKHLVNKMGIHSLRMPALLPLSVKRHLEALNEETFRREMQGYLGKTALDSAVARLNEMKGMIADYEANGSVVDDLSQNIQQSVATLENIIEMNSKEQAKGLKALPAHLFADNIYRLLFP